MSSRQHPLKTRAMAKRRPSLSDSGLKTLEAILDSKFHGVKLIPSPNNPPKVKSKDELTVPGIPIGTLDMSEIDIPDDLGEQDRLMMAKEYAEKFKQIENNYRSKA